MHLDTIDSIAPDSSRIESPVQNEYGQCPSARESAIRDFQTSVPLLIGDLTAVWASWFVSKFLAVLIMGTTGVPGIHSVIAISIAFPIAGYCLGLYPGVFLHPAEELKRIVLGASLAFAGFLVAAFIYRDYVLSHLFIRCVNFILLMVSAISIRMYTRNLFSGSRWWKQPVMVVGDPIEKTQLRNWLAENGNTGLYVGDSSVATNRVIVVSDKSDSLDLLIWRFRELWHVSFLRGEPRVIRTEVNYLFFFGQQFCKRAFDLTVLFLAAPFLLPLTVIIATLIKLTSNGPIFYSQKRLGLGGRYFSAWKFRSMVPNADSVLANHLSTNPDLRDEWQRDHKLKKDPRVTRIGALLRKTSLDELPQLWSVLCGEMSLVGPRPIVDAEIDKYEEVFELYCRVKPGLTGLWQVSGRNNTTYQQRLSYDAYYVSNWSIWLDLYLIFRTVRTVLFCEGAY